MSTGPRRLGKYELQRRLGRGGMAEVWKALDTQLQRIVAIKFLHADLSTDPGFMNRFVREAQAIASLRHPNIVQVHDFQTSTESDSPVYMVMNYIDGPTLAEYIRDTSRMGKFPSATDIVHLFAAIGSAIDYAHSRNMLHRDIKPSNIMLDQKNSSRQSVGKPILMDFGIVKLLGNSALNTQTGTLLGTPHYMSPEQARGLPGDSRSDIYSLGVVLYEICTGVRPFQGDNPSVVMMQHLMAIPTHPSLINPNIPPALAEVILRSLAKEPADRFPNAFAMTAALSEALNVSLPPRLSSPPSLSGLSSGSASDTSSHSNSSAMQSLTPSSSSPSSPLSSSSPYVGAPPTPAFNVSLNDGQSGQSGPFTPAASIGTFPPTHTTGQHAATTTPRDLPPATRFPQLPAPKKRPKSIWIISIVMAITIVVTASLGGLYLLLHRNVPPTTLNPLVGQVFFISSGQVNELDSQGIDDELRIKLDQIRDPASGKSYYAWLLSDEKQNPPQFLRLGPLSVDHGKIDFPYFHDPQHTNLLATYSQFLITEQDATTTPENPFSDKRTWRYYAELPQISDDRVTSRSALDYIRLLLVEADSGGPGIDIQFLRATYQVLTRANSARDFWYKKDAHALRNQIISILDYLDSANLVNKDLPNIPLQVDASRIQIPLLDLSQDQAPSSYISRVGKQLKYLLDSPGVTAEMLTLAHQAQDALPDVQNWLKQVWTDAKHLSQMTDTQLLQSSALERLNNMVSEAQAAYSQVDPSTNQLQGGALWIHNHIQNLVTFNVRKY